MTETIKSANSSSTGPTPNTIKKTPQVSESNIGRPKRKPSNATRTIVCGVALPSIPILVITTVLLYIIFHYRVNANQGQGLPQLHLTTNAVPGPRETLIDYIAGFRKNGGTPAYYVIYNPSTITTIASWTSRVIPYLSSSIMALVAFFVACHLVQRSQNGELDKLPDPKQMTILIGLLGGSGMSPMKDALLHSWRNRTILSAPLPAVFTALFFITLVGILIPVVDTWFGISVHPVVITQLTNTSSANWHSFGREMDPMKAISPDCTQANPGLPAMNPDNFRASWWWPCNILLLLHPMTLVRSDEAEDILLGRSSINTIINSTGSILAKTSGSADHNTTIFLMGDPESSDAVDFEAKTMGISTTCQVMTADCEVENTLYSGTIFKCPGGFAGNFYEPTPGDDDTSDNSYNRSYNTGIGFATDAGLVNYSRLVNFSDGHATDTMPAGVEGQIMGLLAQNPVYFGTWAAGYLDRMTGNSPLGNVSGSGESDPQIFPNGYSDSQWLLNCSANIYDVNYTFVNGSIHTLRAQEAAPDWGAFYTAPLAWSEYFPQVSTAMSAAAIKAAFLAQNSTHLADIWANEFSKMALAFSIGVFGPKVNDIEQLRNNQVFATRVPMIPLYILLCLKLLYVVAVIFLAIGVYCFTHPAETEAIREQLSVQGIAMAYFDQPSLRQANVAGQLQSQFGSVSSETTTMIESNVSDTPQQEKDNEQEKEQEPKVGFVPTPEGTWTFALLMNQAWQSLKPIVEVVVMQEAKEKNLGVFGDAYIAWKK